MLLPVILLSISLSLDAFFVGLSYGIRQIGIPIFSKMILFCISFGCAFVSITAGSSMAGWVPESWSRAIGAGILLLMGFFFNHQRAQTSGGR